MLIVDRFEGGIAVVENDGVMIELPKASLAENVKEGDVIVDCNGLYTVDNEATDERRRKMVARLRKRIKE